MGSVILHSRLYYKNMKNLIRKINTISDYHKLRGLEKPKHPLISLVDYAQIMDFPENNNVSWLHNFYSIAIKKNLDAKMVYMDSKSMILMKE